MKENAGYTVFAVIVIAAVGIVPIAAISGIDVSGYIQNILAEIIVFAFVLGVIVTAFTNLGRR